MHKVYENDDLMMYFKKRYCHCCGKILKIKRSQQIVSTNDPDHSEYCNIGISYKPHGNILVIGKEYYCPSCNKTFSCDKQHKIIEAQKYYQKKIVTDEEIRQTYKDQISISLKKIHKLKCLLLIPVIGSIICEFYIFNGKLAKLTERGDGAKLLFSSIIAFLVTALALKLILPIFNFTNIYAEIFMWISSLFSSNIPTLWYINHRFK